MNADSADSAARQIREVVVVEGIHDRDRVLRATNADVVVTGGSHIGRGVFDALQRVAAGRGIIVLTDPDHAGEQIRRQIARRFPAAKHAYISRVAALNQGDGDIGVENASIAEIVEALEKVRSVWNRPDEVVSWTDMAAFGLVGAPRAAKRRERLGALLRIGYANAKSFHKRLNALSVSRLEFETALSALEEEEER